MSAIEKPTLVLPSNQANFIKVEIASGVQAPASEVVHAKHRPLQERVEPVERWLRDEVAPTYDKMKANPKRGVPASKVFADIRTRHAAQLKAKTP
jgi:antitoxin ParD1/3/4